jgi:hypothetical protein
MVISNEAQGKKLNEGLSYWKESFGARAPLFKIFMKFKLQIIDY